MSSRKLSRLLLVGDSLVEYGDWQELLPGREIVNLGRCGEAVEELRERAANLVRRQAQPDLLLVMIGTNNVAMERFDFLEPYADILEIFRGAWPATLLVVNSLLPMDLYYLAPETVVRLNDRLRTLAERKSTLYLDAWRALVDQDNLALPGILEDEVHLTARGYQLWAGALAELLERQEEGLAGSA
ncbi:MAG TPA: GDSL-type esterase/lipase family protein [Desulfurivibrionaceae bacterium]|nr:GDSL-type esterase/lipase family protein [Desulfurivibrionaceae bacterium]